MSTPILLLGADGQVGWQLQRSLAPLGRVHACDRAACDLADADAVRRLIESCAPRLIVNAAAYTAVDKAESEPELAHRVNAVAPGVIGETARRLGAFVVHYSTDYVYDGSKSTPYVETDPTAPLGVYGHTKLDGERALAASGCRGIVFRTSWVFGARGHNFVKTILRLARERDSLGVVADQTGCPTPAALISTVTGLVLSALRRGEAAGDGVAVYHLAGAGAVSWHGFARAIVDTAARVPGFDLKLTAEAIRPLTTEQYPTPARRPANSRLDCTRLEADFGLEMPDWQPYLERMLQLLALKSANGY